MVKARKVVTKRKRPAHVKKPLDPKEIFPEIKSLPFLKHVGGPPGTSQLDHWAPPVEKIDGLDGNFLGETYALAMVRHMSRHPGEHPILSRIIERMIQRGQLYDPPDYIAQGFISAIAAILIHADWAGVMGNWAEASVCQLEKHEGGPGLSKSVRGSLKRSIAAKRAFLRGEGVQHAPQDHAASGGRKYPGAAS